MSNQDVCKQCGTVIDAGDPSGLCAQCGPAKEGAAVDPPIDDDPDPQGDEALVSK